MIFRRTHPHVDVTLIRAVAPQLLARLERCELPTVVAIGEPADTRRPMIEHKRLAEEVRQEGEWGNSTSLTRRRRGRYAHGVPGGAGEDQCDQAGALRQGSGRDYSMMSSICASNAGEIVNPSARAVFRLITA